MKLLQRSDTPEQQLALLTTALDVLVEPFFVKDLQHRWIACNQAFCTLIGEPCTAILGHSDPDYRPAHQVEVFWYHDDQVFASGEPVIQETEITSTQGITRSTRTRKSPIYTADDKLIGLCGIVIDITEIKQRQYQVQQLESTLEEKAATIEVQRMLLEQVAVPVIQVWDGILLLPLIGVIDSYRAGRILEHLLEAINQYNARVLILDVTGVPLVDTAVAMHLIHSTRAAYLLGCDCILVGIGPHIAQTLIALGIDFSHIETQATLQQGLAEAFRRLHLRVVPCQRR